MTAPTTTIVGSIASAAALPPRRVPLLGVEFDALTEAQTAQHVLDALDAGRGGWIVTMNLDFLRRASSDAAFRATVAAAELNVADGSPLILASRLQGTPLPERVSGSNLIWSIPAAAAGHGKSIFLLGGDAGTAEETARILIAKHPKLRIVGTHCPPFGFERDPQAMGRITAALAAAKPDIVFVALTSPKGEHLITMLRPMLPRAWWVGVGISFSFVSGRVKRAPRWLQRIGMEWLHRMMQEPRRLARRYLVQGLPFAVVLFAKSLMGRFTRRGGDTASVVIGQTAPVQTTTTRGADRREA